MGPRDVCAGFAVALFCGASCTTPYDGAAPDPASVDAGATSADAAAPPDAGEEDAAPPPPPPPCDVTKPFGPPTPLDVVNSVQQERHPRLSADELFLVFTSDRAAPPTEELWYAERKGVTLPFGPAKRLIGTEGGSGGPGKRDDLEGGRAPGLSSDGLEIFFTKAVYGQSDDIFVARRASRTASFGKATSLAEVNGTGFDSYPSLTPNGTELWFMSNRAGGDDIFRAARNADGTFGTPVRADELSSVDGDYAPLLTPDGLRIYFASNRPDGLGDYDIWTATRANEADTFSNITSVVELNSTGIDSPGALSPDGCRMYMYSSRTGQRDLYVATRPPP